MKKKAALGLYSLNGTQTVQLGQNIHTAMTGNGNFTTPSPALADLLAQLTTCTTKINDAEAAADAARLALKERDDELEALRQILTALASYVENIAQGDETIIVSAGMPVRSGPAPITVGQVQNLKLTASDESGELFADWVSPEGTRSNRVQISRDQSSPPSVWEDKLITTKSKCSLNHDLVSGTKVWVRVKAIGANNEGPWSDVAWKTVP